MTDVILWVTIVFVVPWLVVVITANLRS